MLACGVSSLKAAKRPHVGPRPCCSVPVRVCRVIRRSTVDVRNYVKNSPLSGPSVSELAKKLEPFAGCNCYYLLPYACEAFAHNSSAEAADKRRKVQDTLQLIKDTGFNVVRIWAFSNGPGNECLHKDPNVSPNFEPLDWVVAEAQAKGLQLMMTLSNGAPGYGGYWQYVRWARGKMSAPDYPNTDEGRRQAWEDRERDLFWGADEVGNQARRYYETYLELVVKRYKDSNVIHSWDLCNEPRNRLSNQTTYEIGDWVRKMAATVKGLDQKHPVTVGTEGFFGRSKAPEVKVDLTSANCFYNAPGWGENCNWLYEGSCSHLDFVCIHTWADQWREGTHDPGDWLWANMKWVNDHIDACRHHLDGKPLVLQEYNMPTCGQRSEYFKFVKEKYMQDNPLLGVMVWMVAHEGYPQDKYTLYPTCAPDCNSTELTELKNMCCRRL